MRNFRLQLLLCVLMISTHLRAQEGFELPFFDDFEATIINDAIFTKWTTENLEGWHYWHIIPWNGNPGQCVRFQNTELDQDDWLITKPINCAGLENLKVNFSHFFHGPKVPPRLFYTNQYNGNASQSVWEELAYSLGEDENQWYPSDDIIIENPADVIYFAFHYQAAANAGTYFLLDNFSVKSYTPPPPFFLVGNSEHFEYYTNQPENTQYWNEISESLENMYQKYVDNWNSPVVQDYIDSKIKTKVYLTQKAYMDVAGDILDLKAGYFNYYTHEIYLTPLDSPDKINYYKDFNGLAKNTFAKYALALKSVRDFSMNILPEYFVEGFGLYEQGFRPHRDSVVSFVNKYSTQHSHDLFLTFRDFQSNSVKDIIVAYVQRSILFHGGITREGIFPETWNKFLLHFYLAMEEDRLMKYGSTDYFDIYCTSYDTTYVDSIKVWLERTREFYNETYEMNNKNLVGLYVMKDTQMGMDITGYGSFSGGTGGINISPRYYTHPVSGDGIAGYPWLLAHEIGHVYNGIMSPQYMGFGFHHEGMANLSGYLQYGIDWRPASVQIDFILNYYQQNFGRPPTLTEFYTNPHQQQMGTYYGIHPYICGLEFYRMLYENYGGVKIKEFFQAGHDCNAFGKDSVAIHNEYITYLKHIRNLIPLDTLIKLPFYDTMESFDNGWSRPCINNNLDNWDISDNGLNGGNCLGFQTFNDKNQPIETWLVSPKFDISQLHDISTSFDYLTNGNDIALEVYYAHDFNGNTELTNWNFLYECKALDGGWHNTDDISFECSFDSVFIGIKFLTQGNQWDRVKIDNFEVKITSPFDLPTIATNDAISESQTFAILNGAILSDGGTSITQRGFYWSSLNQNPGSGDHVELVSGTTGSFSKTLENLTAGTTYYYRAFATNSLGTSLGVVKQFTTLAQEVLAELPFFDNFNNDYENWKTVSVTGDDVWHISNDDGIDFGKCARFYPTTNPKQANDDWLVSPVFNSKGMNNLAVSFKYLYTADGASPEFYYATSFDGDPANSDWVHIDKSFWTNNWGWQDARIEITNPGGSFVFAVRYNVTANDSYYFLMDDFGIEAFEPVVFNQVGSSEHFVFYNNLQGQNDYYISIKDQLENQYAKLVSIFDRPKSDSIFVQDKKIKVYYSDINDVDQYDENTPVWKSGFYDLNNYSIYLSPIDDDHKLAMYSALNLLAVSELSQLAISGFGGYSYLNPNEANFIECFGLYESGFRPDRIKTSTAIAELGHTPILDDIRGLDRLTIETQRNLCVSYIEACILGVSTENIYPYRENLWQDHLYYFYQIDENSAIRLSRQSDHFNIFCIPRDDQFINPIAQQLEQLFIYFTANYHLNIDHPFNVVIYPDEQTGMKFTDREGLWYNGGIASGTDNFNMLSPHFLENGLPEALNGLIAHEFFHVIHFNLLTRGFIPNIYFHMEGSADFNARHSLGFDIRRDRFWMIRWTFNEYAQNYNVEINLEHISSNPNNELDIYYLGDLFYEYLFINHGGFEKIKQFYISGMDYSVFNASYDEIDNGYINYLKSFISTDVVIQPIDECEFKIYPNPVSDNSTISFKTIRAENVSLSIYNLAGQEIHTFVDGVLSPGLYKFQIEKSKLTPGLYVVSLSTPLLQSNIKFIVND